MDRAASEAERDLERTHLSRVLADPMLSESAALVLSSSTGRIRKDQFKGLSAESAEAVYREQEAQRAAMQEAREQARREKEIEAENLRLALEIHDSVTRSEKEARVAADRSMYLDLKAQQRANKLLRAASAV